MMWTVRGKVAVVTGASGAIGHAVACQLAAEPHGARVVLVSHSRPPPPLLRPPHSTTNKKMMTSSSGNATPSAEAQEDGEGGAVPLTAAGSYQCDITKTKECQQLFQHVAASLGPVGLVVNCAGLTQSKIFLRCSDEDYDRVMNLNLRGALNVTQAALRYGGMRSPAIEKSGGGSVVLAGSVVGTQGNAGQVLYSASKAALSGAVRSLAKEYSSKNLRFNVVAPGLVQDTDMCRELTEAQHKSWIAQCALGRFATVEEVASCIVAVGLSSFMNGKTVEVDGGLK